jgi:hypothetical protein
MGSAGSIVGLVSALSKLQKWIKVYTAVPETKAALKALAVGDVHTADIPQAAEIRFKIGKMRFAIDFVGIRRLKDAD